MSETSYPITNYQPPAIPDYSSVAVRRRLSGPALQGFFRIVKKWRISVKDARLLLGGISGERFKQMSTRPEGRILNPDQLLRVTSLIAIDQALQELLPPQPANAWANTPDMQLPGGTPLYHMIREGPLVLWPWRQSLERQVLERRSAEQRK